MPPRAGSKTIYPDHMDHRMEPRRRTGILLAYAGISLIWGSTFLAIRFSVETIPPLLAPGFRFFLAGIAFCAYLAYRGQRFPPGTELLRLSGLGVLMVGLANAAASWIAVTVDSGVVALAYTTIPLVVYTVDTAASKRAYQTVPVLGLLAGALGIYLLMRGTGNAPAAAPWQSILIAMLGASGWAIGSVRMKHRTTESPPLVIAAIHITSGGAAVLLASVLAGEPQRWDIAATSAKSLLAVLYLMVIGTILAYSLYIWLLRHWDPAKVATYALINPLVALILGNALAGEPITTTIIASAALVIAAVAMVLGTNLAGGPPKISRTEGPTTEPSQIPVEPSSS